MSTPGSTFVKALMSFSMSSLLADRCDHMDHAARGCLSTNRAFRSRLAEGSRPIVIAVTSASVQPASFRQNLMASVGKPAQCLTRRKPLLLGGYQEFSIHKNGRRTVGMVCVKSKDDHDSKSNISSHIPANSRSWVMMMINVPFLPALCKSPKTLSRLSTSKALVASSTKALWCRPASDRNKANRCAVDHH